MRGSWVESVTVQYDMMAGRVLNRQAWEGHVYISRVVEVKNGTRPLIVFRVRIVLLFGGNEGSVDHESFRLRIVVCKREEKMNRIIKKKSVWIEHNELSVSDG